MKNLSDDASLPDTIPELTTEIAIIDQALKDLDIELRDKMALEDPDRQVFYANEIHELRQNKLVLQTRREFRAVQIRRIRYMEG